MIYIDKINIRFARRFTVAVGFLLLFFFTSCSFIKPLGKEKKKSKVAYEKQKVEVERIDSTETEKTPKIISENVTKITEIKVSRKSNGIMLIIKTDAKLKKKHISFFSSDGKTASVTLYQTVFSDDIREHTLSSLKAENIRLFKLEESTQISIELTSPATSHSIIVKNGKTIISIFN